MRKIKLLLFAILSCIGLYAQRNEIFSDHIKTLSVTVDGKWKLPPVITLGQGQHIDVSFDDLTHEYRRYVYEVEHMNAFWKPSEELLQSDYVSGISEAQPIEGYKQSLNTQQLYTHYSLRIPNEDMGLRLSGNYCVTISLDDEQDEPKPVMKAYFSVVEPTASVSLSVTTNTERDWNKSSQQVDFSVNTASLQIRDAESEILPFVLQNRRWDNAIKAPKATYETPSALEWKHQKKLIFDAGNEYRKFELLSTKYASLGIENIRWFSPYYHVTLLESKPRINYIYDEDQDGLYYVRTDDNSDNDTQSEYAFVHFSLKTEMRHDGDYYVNGAFTSDNFLPEYKMHYNIEKGSYEASVYMKQGYYNYQYLFLPKGSTSGLTAEAEGNFYQTENEYMILVYYRQTGSRYDRLVGYGRTEFRINQ